MTTATKYKTYSKYTPSGIDWLGGIPNEWKLKKLKHSVNELVSGGTPDTGNDQNWTDDENGIPWVNIADMTDAFHIQKTEKRITTMGLAEKNLRILPKQTLLYSMYASLGKVALLDIEAVTNQAIIGVVEDKRKAISDFIKWWLISIESHLSLFSTSSTQNNLNEFKIKNMPLFLPSLSHQQSIADFLDRKTAKIDEMVAKKQKMLELLKEKRQALITHAVTKGLNLKAKMKPSGIDWLGDIPEEWKVRRLRFVIKTNPTKQEVRTNELETEVSFIPMDAVSEEGEIDLSTTKMLEEVIDGYTYFRDGDVVIAKITPCFENGKCAIMHNLTNGVGFGTTEFHVLRATDIDPEYLYLITKIYPFKAFGEANMKGAAGQKRVPEDFIKNFSLGLPKITEQKEVVAFLDHKMAKIDEMMQKVKDQIEKLQEYRQALITNAVTGKIMVS